MDFLVQALGGSAASSTASEAAAGPGVAGSGAGASAVGAMVPNGALGGVTVAKGLDLSNLLSSNASLSGFGGPFAKGGSMQMLGDIPINSGQAHQMASPTQRRPQDDFLMSLFQ